MAEKKKMENEVGEIEKSLQKTAVSDESTYLDLMDSARFEHLQRVASVFAASKLVPKHFQGNKADCLIACQMAMRLDVDPMMLMQNTYIVSGNPGMEAKLMIALMNSRGPFTGPVQFRLEGEGMKRKCVAYATHTKTGQQCEAECTMELAKAERWIDKDGSKWKTMPDLMLQYRSAAFLARLYCPEVLMGLKTKDELEDIGEIIDVTPEAPLAMPRSVKEAEGGDENDKEAGKEDDGQQVEEPAGGQGGVDDHADSGRPAVSETEATGGRGAKRGGRRPAETAGAGDAGNAPLFSDPDEDEAAEILRREKGGYGPS
jgi:hypothetical protein